MKRPSLAVRRYRHSSTHPYYLDLRAFNQGRKFFKTKAEAEAERMRQITLLERGGREAMGLALNELAAIVQARSALAKHGKSINGCGRFLSRSLGANQALQYYGRSARSRSARRQTKGRLWCALPH